MGEKFLKVGKRKKALPWTSLAILTVATLYTSAIADAAAGVTTQAEADANLNTPLKQGNVTYGGTGIAGDTFGSIHATEALTIGGNSVGNHSLTLNGEMPLDWSYKTAYNIDSSSANNTVTLQNLDSLQLSLSSPEFQNKRSSLGRTSNIRAISGGTVTVDESVKNLSAENSIALSNMGDRTSRSTIYAGEGGTVKIYSPQITLTTKGQYENVSAGTHGTIYLGDTDHIVNSVSLTAIDNGQQKTGLAATADTLSSTYSHVYVFSKNLSIINMMEAICSKGYASNPNGDALVQVGSKDAPAEVVTIENRENGHGVNAIDNGKIRLYGKKIAITTLGTDVNVKNGGKITVGAGSGTDEGLILRGGKDHDGEGIAVRDKNSRMDVLSGNVDIKNFRDATFIGWRYPISLPFSPTPDALNYGGTLNLGTQDSPLNNVTISNSESGLSTYHNGSIHVNAKNLTIENVGYPINLDAARSPAGGPYGTITVHTSGTAAIQGTGDHFVIANQTGTAEINTEPNDGTTKLVGTVVTQDGGITNLDFHTDQSFFYGNVFDCRDELSDIDGKTTVSLSDGAIWNLNDNVNNYRATESNTVPRSVVYPDGSTWNSVLDTLRLSTGGTFNLGTAGNKAVENHNYANVKVTHLSGEGGNLLFRTNLQESASDKTVNGHGDQLFIIDSSLGSHDIMINDYSKTYNREANDGYVLLVKDESVNPEAVFTGNAQLQNGGLFTHKVEVTNKNPDESLGYTDVPSEGTNWYVRMTDEPVPQPEPEPQPQPEPQPEPQPQPQPRPMPNPHMTENGENNTYLNRSRYAALWLEQDTLQKRLGELRSSEQDDGLWVRLRRGEYRVKGLEGLSGFTMYQIGYDRELKRQGKTRRFVGGAYHHTDVDFGHPRMGEDSGMNLDVASIYYTTLWDKGDYLDLVGQWGSANGKIKAFGDYPENARWSGNVYTLSAEYGRRAELSKGWYAEPQAQLTYSHLSGDTYTSSQGTYGYLEGINSLIFRTGLTAGRKLGRTEYYGKLF